MTKYRIFSNTRSYVVNLRTGEVRNYRTKNNWTFDKVLLSPFLIEESKDRALSLCSNASHRIDPRREVAHTLSNIIQKYRLYAFENDDSEWVLLVHEDKVNLQKY